MKERRRLLEGKKAFLFFRPGSGCGISLSGNPSGQRSGAYRLGNEPMGLSLIHILGVRQRGSAGGGDNKVSMSAYNVAVNQTGEWILRRYSSEIVRGQVQIKDVSACNVAIQAAGDTITVFVDGQEVHNYCLLYTSRCV